MSSGKVIKRNKLEVALPLSDHITKNPTWDHTWGFFSPPRELARISIKLDEATSRAFLLACVHELNEVDCDFELAIRVRPKVNKAQRSSRRSSGSKKRAVAKSSE